MAVGLLFVGIAIGLLIAGGIALVRAIAPGGRDAAGSRDQLRVTVDRTGREPWSVAFRDDAPRCPPPADLALQPAGDVYRILREHGGVDFGATEVRLTLHAHGASEVEVRDITVTVVRRDPAFAGRLMGIGSGGARNAGALVYDLDDADDTHTVRADPAPEPITARRDEPVTVVIAGITTSAYCQWRIHLDTEVDGEARRMTVGDRDLPFETTGGDPSSFPNGLERLD